MSQTSYLTYDNLITPEMMLFYQTFTVVTLTHILLLLIMACGMLMKMKYKTAGVIVLIY